MIFRFVCGLLSLTWLIIGTIAILVGSFLIHFAYTFIESFSRADVAWQVPDVITYCLFYGQVSSRSTTVILNTSPILLLTFGILSLFTGLQLFHTTVTAERPGVIPLSGGFSLFVLSSIGFLVLSYNNINGHQWIEEQKQHFASISTPEAAEAFPDMELADTAIVEEANIARQCVLNPNPELPQRYENIVGILQTLALLTFLWVLPLTVLLFITLPPPPDAIRNASYTHNIKQEICDFCGLQGIDPGKKPDCVFCRQYISYTLPDKDSQEEAPNYTLLATGEIPPMKVCLQVSQQKENIPVSKPIIEVEFDRHLQYISLTNTTTYTWKLEQQRREKNRILIQIKGPEFFQLASEKITLHFDFDSRMVRQQRRRQKKYQMAITVKSDYSITGQKEAVPYSLTRPPGRLEKFSDYVRQKTYAGITGGIKYLQKAYHNYRNRE